MAAKDHSHRIAVVMPYHNNLHDFLKTLSKISHVYVITPRSFRKKTHLAPPVPTQKLYNTPRLGPITHAYNPFALWQAITPDTTHILIKHIDLLENIVPIIIAKLKKIQIIAMVQQVKASKQHTIVLRCAASLTHATNTTVFSVTHNGYQALKPLLPTTTYLPACINPTRFSLAKMHTEKINQLRVLAIGKYVQRKNFIPLIEAISQIHNQYPSIPIQLTLVGPKSDSSLYNQITKIVSASPSLHNTVHIHSDISPNKIPKILAYHNLFILPASSEPLGYSLLEAMATGLPVIANHEVGSASYIEQGKNGFIIPNANPATIKSAILSFTTPNQTLDTAKILRFGQHSRDLVKKYHSPDAIIKKIEQIFV